MIYTDTRTLLVVSYLSYLASWKVPPIPPRNHDATDCRSVSSTMSAHLPFLVSISLSYVLYQQPKCSAQSRPSEIEENWCWSSDGTVLWFGKFSNLPRRKSICLYLIHIPRSSFEMIASSYLTFALSSGCAASLTSPHPDFLGNLDPYQRCILSCIWCTET